MNKIWFIATLLAGGLVGTNYVAGAPDSEGLAPCTMRDGYQTVHFDNDTSYSGEFLDCRPLAGRAHFTQGAVTLDGYAQPVDNYTVILESGTKRVRLTLRTRGRRQ